MKIFVVLFFSILAWSSNGQSNFANEKVTPFEVTYQSLKLYPNPVVSNAILEFKLVDKAQVKVTLFNILGGQVRNLINEDRTPGRQSVQFSANQLDRGTYFIKLIINGEIIKTIRVAVSPS